jgi:hypothetical protein
MASTVMGIAYDGSRVLCAGFNEGEGFSTAVFWQNSTEYPLDSGEFSSVNQAAFDGSKLYVVGYHGSASARLWSIQPGATPSITSDDLGAALGVSWSEATSVTCFAGTYIAAGFTESAGVYRSYTWKGGVAEEEVLVYSDAIPLAIAARPHP